MEQVEISQVLADCNAKREALSNHRDSINKSQKQLLKVASQRLAKEDLTDLEHYQNQFHIQLINIHDLKHSIKFYDHQLEAAQRSPGGIPSHLEEERKKIDEEYQYLENTLADLNRDFETFVKAH